MPRRPVSAALAALAVGALAVSAGTVAGVVVGSESAGAATTAAGVHALAGKHHPKHPYAPVKVHVPRGVPQPPTMPARGYLLADLTTGDILVERNPHGRYLPASTLKVLTALTLLPRLNPKSVYVAKPADMNMDGTRVGVVAGSPYTVHQLFQGLLMASGNDAANALANAAGGVKKTVALMQQTAAALGAEDTTVGDPSGLDAPRQRTSAYDLALIARAAMKRPDFRHYVATKYAKFPGAKGKGKHHKAFQISNHNRLLFEYRGAIGVKPGYTVAAKWTFVGAAKRGGHTYLVTELKLDEQGWAPTMKLLTWAFKHGAKATPVDTLAPPATPTKPTSTPTAAAPTAAAPAGTAALETDASGSADRWLGLAGLAAAVGIVGALGVSVRGARRRRTGPHA